MCTEPGRIGVTLKEWQISFFRNVWVFRSGFFKPAFQLVAKFQSQFGLLFGKVIFFPGIFPQVIKLNGIVIVERIACAVPF